MYNPEMEPDPLIERWLDFKRHNEGRAASTVGNYRLALARLRWWIETKQQKALLEATPKLLEEFCGLYLYEQGLSPRTRILFVAAVRGFYAWAFRYKLVTENPSSHLPAPKVGLALPRPAQLDHAERILMEPDLSTFRGLRDAAMLSVLVGCGCRRSGLIGLHEEDLIWFKSSVKTERLVIRFNEKGQNERLVPAPLETGLLIRAYLGHEELEKIERSTRSGKRILFVNLHSRLVKKHDHIGEYRRLNPSSIDRMIKEYGKRANVPPRVCHAHAFRHLFGTELAEADIDLLQRQALLGHQDPKSTEVYTHLAIRKLQKTVDQANPLGKIKTPVSELAKLLRGASHMLVNTPR